MNERPRPQEAIIETVESHVVGVEFGSLPKELDKKEVFFGTLSFLIDLKKLVEEEVEYNVNLTEEDKKRIEYAHGRVNQFLTALSGVEQKKVGGLMTKEIMEMSIDKIPHEYFDAIMTLVREVPMVREKLFDDPKQSDELANQYHLLYLIFQRALRQTTDIKRFDQKSKGKMDRMTAVMELYQSEKKNSIDRSKPFPVELEDVNPERIRAGANNIAMLMEKKEGELLSGGDEEIKKAFILVRTFFHSVASPEVARISEQSISKKQENDKDKKEEKVFYSRIERLTENPELLDLSQIPRSVTLACRRLGFEDHELHLVFLGHNIGKSESMLVNKAGKRVSSLELEYGYNPLSLAVQETMRRDEEGDAIIDELYRLADIIETGMNGNRDELIKAADMSDLAALIGGDQNAMKKKGFWKRLKERFFGTDEDRDQGVRDRMIKRWKTWIEDKGLEYVISGADFSNKAKKLSSILKKDNLGLRDAENGKAMGIDIKILDEMKDEPNLQNVKIIRELLTLWKRKADVCGFGDMFDDIEKLGQMYLPIEGLDSRNAISFDEFYKKFQVMGRMVNARNKVETNNEQDRGVTQEERVSRSFRDFEENPFTLYHLRSCIRRQMVRAEAIDPALADLMEQDFDVYLHGELFDEKWLREDVAWLEHADEERGTYRTNVDWLRKEVFGDDVERGQKRMERYQAFFVAMYQAFFVAMKDYDIKNPEFNIGIIHAMDIYNRYVPKIAVDEVKKFETKIEKEFPGESKKLCEVIAHMEKLAKNIPATRETDSKECRIFFEKIAALHNVYSAFEYLKKGELDPVVKLPKDMKNFSDATAFEMTLSSIWQECEAYDDIREAVIPMIRHAFADRVSFVSPRYAEELQERMDDDADEKELVAERNEVERLRRQFEVEEMWGIHGKEEYDTTQRYSEIDVLGECGEILSFTILPNGDYETVEVDDNYFLHIIRRRDVIDDRGDECIEKIEDIKISHPLDNTGNKMVSIDEKVCMRMHTGDYVLSGHEKAKSYFRVVNNDGEEVFKKYMDDVNVDYGDYDVTFDYKYIESNDFELNPDGSLCRVGTERGGSLMYPVYVAQLEWACYDKDMVPSVEYSDDRYNYFIKRGVIPESVRREYEEEEIEDYRYLNDGTLVVFSHEREGYSRVTKQVVRFFTKDAS